jgi:hypothetical protein
LGIASSGTPSPSLNARPDLQRAGSDPRVELPVQLVRRLDLDAERGVRVDADDDTCAVGAGAGLDALSDEVDDELFAAYAASVDRWLRGHILH